MLARSRKLLALVAVLFLAFPAWADENLSTEVNALAADVKKLLDGQGESSIIIGAFTSAPKMRCQRGAGIRPALGQALRDMKIDVRERGETDHHGQLSPGRGYHLRPGRRRVGCAIPQ